ncbi:MAG TPA: S24 family peptidase [Bacteroidia bacterium]|nr:S24 family peptidase [Bacteroidia bacterium]
MKALTKNIEEIRKKKSLSRETVANELSITLSTYAKIERGETGLTVDRLYQLATVFKMPPADILNYHQYNKGNVTYIPVNVQEDFLAGNLQNDIREYKTYSIPIVHTRKGYMINVTGDSMFPVIVHGDHVIVEPIENINHVKYGYIYVLITKDDGLTIKRIHSHQNKKKLILKSDNTIYEPFDIDKKNIISVWLVKDYKLTSLNSLSKYLLPENGKQKGDSQQKK